MGKISLFTNSFVSLSLLVIFGFLFEIMKDNTREFSLNMTRFFINHNNAFFIGYFWFFCTFLFYFISIIVFVMLYILKDKIMMMNALVLVFFKLFLTHFLKIYFHDTRPCFIDDQIAKYHCSCEFGFPSGHASEAFIMFFWILYEILYKNGSYR